MSPSEIPAGPEDQPEVNSQEVVEPIAPVPTGEVANIEAPPPTPEILHDANEGSNQDAGAPQFDASQLPQPVQPAATPVDPVPTQDDSDGDDTTTPVITDEKERIETEWVNRAKDVVENTRSDPYQQEHEVSKLQAEYLKKKYGKNLKLREP